MKKIFSTTSSTGKNTALENATGLRHRDCLRFYATPRADLFCAKAVKKIRRNLLRTRADLGCGNR
jgi:hypothetical protein